MLELVKLTADHRHMGIGGGRQHENRRMDLSIQNDHLDTALGENILFGFRQSSLLRHLYAL
jgi:hypothetical protein